MIAFMGRQVYCLSRSTMLRRVTAVLGMLAILGLLGVLVWEVYHHHRRRFTGESAIVVNFARGAAVIA
jgi:xanthosine utilization system XapX-like protein